MTAIAAPITPQTVDVDGCALSYLRHGSGPTVLFLHGAGGVMGWTPWMERLAASYDLIVPDHPGWGRTPAPDWFDNIHDLAYFYLDVIKALRLKNVHLVGNSIGGWLASEIAVRNTDDVKTLTLLAPAGLRVKGVKKFDMFLATPDEMIRALYHDQAIAERLLAQPMSEAQADIVLRNRYASARVAWQPRLYDPHLTKWLHRVNVPTLVLWGENDRMLPIAMQAEFVRLIPEAQAVTIPACGHLPHAECTDAFLKHFMRFVQGVAS
jgi:pimeloyl-ACP methyl ester carboxylesterase